VRRVDRRRGIVDAALGLLAERGADVTIAEIAAAAGVSEGTVFYAFTDRAELLAECLDRLLDAGDLTAALAAAEREPSPRVRLVHAARALRASMMSVVPVMLAIVRSPSLGPGPSLDRFGAIEQTMERIVAGPHADEVWVASPAELAGELMGLMFGQVFRHLVGGAPLPSIERTIDTFLGGALVTATGGRSGR
jgi:AcrR family transcriptional regulator